MKHIVFALSLLLLSACAQLPGRPPTPDIEQLLTEHRYLSALKAVDLQRQRDGGHEQQREQIIARARDYQRAMLEEARALQQQSQFAKAQRLFETARAELPASAALDEFASQFYPARDHYIQRHLDELVRLRAPALARQNAAYLALCQAAAEPELEALVERQQQDIQYFAPLIAQAGAQALDQGEYTRAKQYLAIANLLTPSPELAQQLKSAEQAVAASRQKKQIARTTEKEQRYRDLMYALHQSLDQRDFLAARDQLEQARALNIHTSELDAIQKQLDEAIATFVALHVDSGDRLYANGRIEDALRHWRLADVLSPSPEIKEKIEKARKFIGRLHQLQQTAPKPKSHQ